MKRTTRCPAPAGSHRAHLARRPSDRPTSFVFACLCAALLLVAAPATSSADEVPGDFASAQLFLQSGSGHQQGSFTGTVDLPALLGAQRFYNAGLTGANAVMANIEAGYAWTGHESLSHVGLIPTSASAAGEFDRHGTWVSMVMGGRPGGLNPGPYQAGMAPDAQFYSGAIATSWPAANPSFPRYSVGFNVSFASLSTYGPYRAAFITGIAGPGGTRTADVVNTSWIGSNNSQGLTGTDRLAGTFDALVNENPRTLFVQAAGNTLPGPAGPNKVPSPASAFNNLTVGALSPNGTAYDIPSVFSNYGPNDYIDPTLGSVVVGVRQVVDIAAPGENFSIAYYGGETGGNGPTVFGAANGPAGGPDWYTRNVGGTSFSAPTVAGGAALLYDAAHTLLGSTPDARDARVMKAVLMNSADKTIGWDNGQIAHPNGNGGVLTTQSVDSRVGAGRMNLDAAFDQLLSGTTDVPSTGQGLLGTVAAIGWDFGLVSEGITNDYLIGSPLVGGSTFTATLNWFRDRRSNGQTNFFDDSYDNLDLELWDTAAGIATDLISASNSRYNNSEHFSFMVPSTSQYMLRVRWTEEIFDLVSDLNSEHYGLAWAGVAIPEPGTWVLVLLALPLVASGRARRPRA